jgi:hypothetical protein
MLQLNKNAVFDGMVSLTLRENAKKGKTEPTRIR